MKDISFAWHFSFPDVFHALSSRSSRTRLWEPRSTLKWSGDGCRFSSIRLPFGFPLLPNGHFHPAPLVASRDTSAHTSPTGRPSWDSREWGLGSTPNNCAAVAHPEEHTLFQPRTDGTTTVRILHQCLPGPAMVWRLLAWTGRPAPRIWNEKRVA